MAWCSSEGAGEAAEMVIVLSGWRSRVGGADSGQVSEAGFCVEGQHDALSPQRVRGDDEVVSPPGHPARRTCAISLAWQAAVAPVYSSTFDS